MNLDFVQFCWLFGLAVTLHNLEEALYLPAWSKTTRRPVAAREFRFAVLILTLLAYGLVGWASISSKEGVAAYLISGYAFAMLVNTLFPHAVMTVLTRRYMPGLATALLLNLPISILLLREGFQAGYIKLERFVWAGPGVAIVLLLSLPLLFGLGRVLTLSGTRPLE